MREIKFRFWFSDEEVMSPTKTIQQIAIQPHLILDWDTPLQYTGLKDKNGKEIYEGDIVRLIEPVENWPEDKRAQFDQLDFVGTIEWDNEGADYNIKGNDFLRGFGVSHQVYEVIGNIYENKELLK